jgi:hypothetical protein
MLEACRENFFCLAGAAAWTQAAFSLQLKKFPIAEIFP